MKTLFLLVLLLGIIIMPVTSQTSDDLRRESSTDNQVIQDNSERAILWNRVIEAKHQRNESLYFELLNEYNQRFPNVGEQVQPGQDGPTSDRVPNPPFTGDWGTGDIRIFAGALPLGPANNSQGIFDLEVDSLGNKFAALINASRDNLFVYRSTDQGTTWTLISNITPGGSTKWQTLDMYITDSSGAFRVGIAACRTTTTSSFDGQLYWLSIRSDGSGFRAQQVITGSDYLNPSIISDGFEFPAGSSYWYITYQRVNTGTGVGTQCLASMSTNWGYTWQHDTVRSGFNDFNLSINYASYSIADTIYVAITNDITASDPNLRIFRIRLGSFGTATGWTQFNVANTGGLAEFDCDLAVNRTNDQMGITYTAGTGNTNILGRYYDGTTYWGTVVNISAQSNAESRSRLNCQDRQGAYRMAFISNGTRDTVIYISSFTMSGLSTSGRQVVNQSASSGASTSTSPDVAGFYISAGSFGGGVVFSLLGPQDLYYDASNITPTGIHQNGNNIPSIFSLSQNYPNPFNPTTNIKFSIPKAGVVKVMVYDAMGREVAMIVNENLNAGNFTADFNASSLSSGVYFYKLTSGDFTDTKKMMLIK